jgi:hypothetical protein
VVAEKAKLFEFYLMKTVFRVERYIYGSVSTSQITLHEESDIDRPYESINPKFAVKRLHDNLHVPGLEEADDQIAVARGQAVEKTVEGGEQLILLVDHTTNNYKDEPRPVLHLIAIRIQSIII